MADVSPAVLIFRKRLLPWSETFIATQARALPRYRPVFVGYRREMGGAGYLDGCATEILYEHGLLGRSGFAKAMIKGFGHVPAGWRRALQRHAPDLVHAHFGTSAAPAGAIARALDIPLVVTYHGHDIATAARSNAHARARRAAFDGVARAIAVSDFIAERVRAAGCPADRIVVHHMGVDTERFAPGGAVVPGRVLFVGRLVEKKGLIHLLRAFPAVTAEITDAELIVAGDGPLRPSLEAEAHRLGVRARFLGVQTPDQVLELLRSAALLAAPSVVTRSGNAEGLPITIMEAAATGVPVVAFPSGGSADGVRDGETGRLIEPGDEAALAAAIREILGDDARRARMAGASRRFALEQFSVARQSALLETIYDEVVSSRP